MNGFHDVFNYDPGTGVLTRKINTGSAKAGDVAGCKRSNGYLVASINNKQLRVHRIAWEMHYGMPPKGSLDHINGVRDDNRICNIRDVTFLENNRNTRIGKRNKSGIIGVTWEGDRSKWLAYIGVNNRLHLKLGRFDDLLSACCARKSAEIKEGYHENHGKKL